MTSSSSGTPPTASGVLHRGRVVDVAPVAGGIRVALLVEDRTVFLTAPAGTPVQRGDLVEVRATNDAQVIALTRLGGPSAPWRETGDALRWRRPSDAPSRIAHLKLRAQVLQALRAYLDGEGFVEVDTPALVRAPSPEPQFAPIGAGRDWLITSPEFQLK